MKPHPQLIIALDVDQESRALDLADRLRPYAGMFKIGKALFTRYGPRLVETLRQRGVDIFLDLKFHDIPNTAAMASLEAARLGVRLLNVHAQGGSAMMRAVAEILAPLDPRPRCLAVTLLTSLDPLTLREELGVAATAENYVLKLARLARQSGLDGVVASPEEVGILRRELGRDFIVLTPGIRPAGAQKQDQKRTRTPGDALRDGADYIVVGRPILAAADPEAAAEAIVREMREVTG